jgi:L-fuconolactonase
MPVTDSHQHVWDPSRARYDWLAREAPELNRTIGFDEAVPELRRAGIDATVLVQSADNDADTDFMLEVAAQNPMVAGVVAYVPLHDPPTAARRLAALQKNPIIVGVRNLIHDRPDPDWLLRDDVDEGLGLLEDAGVPFDLVGVLPRHLEIVPIIGERHPQLRMVIDHLAKPPIGRDEREPWWGLIASAAENPLVFGKVSGLYSATADGASWTVDGVRPFVHRALEVFGSDRLMYGGDWPISIPNGGYQRVWSGLSEIFAELNELDRNRILDTTAQAFYGLSPVRLDRAATPQKPR